MILREGVGLEVRDYKTSEEARSFEETSVQVRLYTLGLNGLGRIVEKGSIAYLEEADVKDVPVLEGDLELVRIQAERIVECIKGSKFKPRPGEWCGGCDRKPICRWSGENEQ